LTKEHVKSKESSVISRKAMKRQARKPLYLTRYE